jgi:lipopolysaccharide/colanic/teichoic acid biosynthesis glycosyltransferase
MDAITTKVAHPDAAALPPEPEVVEHVPSRLTTVGCRLLDIVVAAVLLVLLAPLMAIIALVIRLDERGKVVYRQRRVGHHQKPFTVNKFRTMHENAGHENHRAFVLKLIEGDHPGADDAAGEEAERPFFKIKRDPRVTSARARRSATRSSTTPRTGSAASRSSPASPACGRSAVGRS